MDPLNHEFLFDYSGPRPSKMMSEGKETVEVTRKIATIQLKAKGDKDCIIRSQVCPLGEKLFGEHIGPCVT